MGRYGLDRDAIRAHPGYVLLFSYGLVYLSWQAFEWLPGERSLAGDGFFLPLSFGFSYLAWRAAGRSAGSARVRRAWLWILAAYVALAAGDVALIVDEHVAGHFVYPSASDVFYLAFYPLMLMGVLSFPGMRRNAQQALELLLDCAIVALGGAAVFVYFILGPDALAGSSAIEALVTIAYPIGDSILLVALAAAVLGNPLPEARASLTWLVAAIALFVVGDLIAGYAAYNDSYRAGDPVDILYFVAYALFVVAAVQQRRVEEPEPFVPRVREERTSILPYAAVAACFGILLFEEAGQPFLPDLATAMIVTLVTALVVVRQLLSMDSVRNAHERLEQAQAFSHLGSWEWDVERDRLDVSTETARILGIEQEPALTRDEAMQTIDPGDRETVEELLNGALVSGEPFSLELHVVRPDGDVRTLLSNVEVEMRGERPIRARGTYQDVTDRKRMENQLRHQADHDPLTGLFNRRRFARELDDALRYAARYGRPGAMLILDVDDFKLYNDARGHAAGDLLLKRIASALERRARETDVVARLGADEFAILLPEADERRATGVAEDVRRVVAKADGADAVRLSAGVAPFGDHRQLVADDVLIAADVALFEAKERGKNQVCVYSGRTRAAVTWIERIRSALAEERFVLFAQPMVDLRSEEVTHRELLIRMLADGGETIAPQAFMPTAERFGLSNEIDRWVTGEGLELARRGERVSVNLSAPSIGDGEILAAVRTAIVAGVKPSSLIFEITETAAMRNMDAARSFAETLEALGCGVALDDFGTGFASFAYLKHLPARYLKIDMEFVRDVVSNPTDRQIVKAITGVAHSLRKRTIAEGVESRETMRALRELGVDWGQGFYIGRPERISPPAPVERRSPPVRHGR